MKPRKPCKRLLIDAGIRYQPCQKFAYMMLLNPYNEEKTYKPSMFFFL